MIIIIIIIIIIRIIKIIIRIKVDSYEMVVTLRE